MTNRKPIDWDNLIAPTQLHEVEWRIMEAGRNKRNGQLWVKIVPYMRLPALIRRLVKYAHPGNYQFDGLETVPGIPFTMKKDRPAPGLQVYSGAIARLSLFDNGEWLHFTDTADVTDIEALKGSSTGAYRRCARLIPIGLDLYEIGTIYGDLTTTEPTDKTDWTWAMYRPKENAEPTDKAQEYWWRVPLAKVKSAFAELATKQIFIAEAEDVVEGDPGDAPNADPTRKEAQQELLPGSGGKVAKNPADLSPEEAMASAQSMEELVARYHSFFNKAKRNEQPALKNLFDANVARLKNAKA